MPARFNLRPWLTCMALLWFPLMSDAKVIQVEATQSLANANKMAKAGDTLRLARGGVWRETLELKSGVRYEAGSDASKPAPTISGAMPLGSLDWQRISGTPTGNTLAIYRAQLPALIRNVGQIYYQDQRLQRARYPNLAEGDFGIGYNKYLRIASSVAHSSGNQITLERPLPTLADLKGASAYVRYAPWALGQYLIADHEPGSRQVVIKPCTDLKYCLGGGASVPAGHGVWFEGKLWMLDRPGEWHLDTDGGWLYLAMPDGSSPRGQKLEAAVLDNGIAGRDLKQVAVVGLRVERTLGNGIDLDRIGGTLQLSDLSIINPGWMGISVTNSTQLTGAIDRVEISQSVHASIYLGGDSTRGINVTRSVVRQAGQGYFAPSAILLGQDSQATGNTVIESSAIGIHAWANSSDTNRAPISGNHVKSSCLEFDDCGGIYAIGRIASPRPGHPLNLLIQDNIVVSSPDERMARLDGLPAGARPQTKGIYLDDFAGSSEVRRNLVKGHDFGIMLHHSRDIVVADNTVIDSTQQALWLQEDRRPEPLPCAGIKNCSADGYMANNLVTGNILATASGGSIVHLDSDYRDVDQMGRFTDNRYILNRTPWSAGQAPFNKASPKLRQTSLKAWLSKTGKRDVVVASVASGVVARTSLKGLLIGPDSLVPDAKAWTSYLGQVSYQTGKGASGPRLLTHAAEGAPVVDSEGRRSHILYTARNFSLQQGRQYLVAFDAASSQAGDRLWLTMRDNARQYAQSSTGGAAVLQTRPQRLHWVLTAWADVRGTARLDLDLQSAGTVSISGVRVQEISTTPVQNPLLTLYNAGQSAETYRCPLSSAVSCGRFTDVATGKPAAFPITLEPGTYRILVRQDPDFKDVDQDGVPDMLDACPATDTDDTVDENGCSLEQDQGNAERIPATKPLAAFSKE